MRDQLVGPAAMPGVTYLCVDSPIEAAGIDSVFENKQHST
jgi:hypothetical protein